MFKKIGILAVTLVLCISLLAGTFPEGTLAAGDIALVSSTATPDFPSSINFQVQATSSAPIVDVRLHFTVERDSFVKVMTEEKLGFNSSTSITAAYYWNLLQSGGMPGGTVVNFWWTIADSSGKTLTTPQQQFSFDDTRFTWSVVSQGNIDLYWYGNGNAVIQTLMDTAQQGLDDLETNTGARLSRPVSIYIYENTPI
jgi:hypothetical protein